MSIFTVFGRFNARNVNYYIITMIKAGERRDPEGIRGEGADQEGKNNGVRGDGRGKRQERERWSPTHEARFSIAQGRVVAGEKEGGHVSFTALAALSDRQPTIWTSALRLCHR